MVYSGACDASQLPKNISNIENHFGAAGARRLAAGLRENHTITSLDLSGNIMMAEGVSEVIGALKENNTIQSLNLWGNMMGVEGAKQLSEWLKANKTIRKLNLRGNNLVRRT